MPIRLVLNLPEKTLAKETADKVILPVAEGNLTVIKERAPRLQLLVAGDVILLDADNQEIKRFAIGGGLADIAEDVCTVAAKEVK